MPELPEVETVCRGLATVLVGRIITGLTLHRPDLRFPFPENLSMRVQGSKVISVRRRAKYILIHLNNDAVMIAHLGMSGRMVIGQTDGFVRAKHDHVVITTDHGITIRLNDARRFGFLDITDASSLTLHPMLVSLGPEPLGNELSGPVLAALLMGKKTPIKAALLDQRLIAGLGNIYVCEALYFAGINPTRIASSITLLEAERLAAAIKEVLTRAIAAGGSSLRNYVQTSGELGYFQHQWAVYGKEDKSCPVCTCNQGVRRIVQSNRSTFFCETTQH